MKALVLVCTLKKSPAPSSSDRLAREVLTALADHDVDGEIVRVVDHDVRFGVSTDEGDGDAWPGIRDRLMASEILVIATPIWLGQPSAVCKMVLERLDAELSEKHDDGRLRTYGKVAPKPDTTGRVTKALAANTAHLARLLAATPYPPGS